LFQHTAASQKAYHQSELVRVEEGVSYAAPGVEG